MDSGIPGQREKHKNLESEKVLSVLRTYRIPHVPCSWDLERRGVYALLIPGGNSGL